MALPSQNKSSALIERGAKISTPLQSPNFLLINGLQILKHKLRAGNVAELCKPETIMDVYNWLIVYLQKEATKLESQTQRAKNNTQVFYAKRMAIAFAQRLFLERLLAFISRAPDAKIKKDLLRLFSFYGLWVLEKFLPILYEGGYVQGSQPTQLFQEALLTLCSEFKDDAVYSLIMDAIAPRGSILNRVLKDLVGQVSHKFENIQGPIYAPPIKFMYQVYQHFQTGGPSWWQEMVNWRFQLQNKL